MIRLTDALLVLRPEGGYTIEEDESIQYFGDSTNKPTLKKIKEKQVELQAEYDTQAYARKRAVAYPSVGDQLDMLMKDMKNGTKTHQEACEAVKTKFPKS